MNTHAAVPLPDNPNYNSLGFSPGFMNLDNIAKAEAALPREGYLIIENGYHQDMCQEIIKVMDTLCPDKRVERRYSGTEMRIWDAQKQHRLFETFYQECNLFASNVMGHEMSAYTLLAIRNRALDPSDLESAKGRWHIDSFRKQLKIFLFLTDTTESSGPFEFIPGTHMWNFKLRMVCKGAYFTPSDLFKTTRRYQHLDEADISKVLHSGRGSRPAICKAGTVMVVNTSAIHRARPCREGSRYALTAYF